MENLKLNITLIIVILILLGISITYMGELINMLNIHITNGLETVIF